VEAAQRVLTETQRLITDAVRDTKALAERNNEISQTAKEANRKLIEEQMTPLFQGFRAALDAYRADQDLPRQRGAQVTETRRA
jgi:hypothetical protein